MAKKKMFITILVVMLVLSITLLSACGGESGGTAVESEDTQQPTEPNDTDSQTAEETPVEIRVAWWGDTTRHQLYNQICDVFESKYPNIKLVREPASWADYWSKLTVQSASGGAPDFMGMHPFYGSDYVQRGVIEPLDAFIQDGVIDVSNFPQSAVDSGKLNNIVYMIPMGITIDALLVNNSMLKDLEVTTPNFDWTWDDLKAIGTEARAALDAKGKKDSWLMDDMSGVYEMFRVWARQNGRVDLYTPEGDIAYTEEDVKGWFTMWNDLRKSGIIPDAATASEYANAALEDTLLVRGRAAIRRIPVNQYKMHCIALPEDELIMVRHPSKPDGDIGEFVYGAHFAVSSKTTPEKKLAAAKLINFWVNDEDSIELFRLDQGVPANTKMVEFLTPLLDEQDKPTLDYVNKLMPLAKPIIFAPAGATEVDSLFKTLADEVRFEKKTPEEAATELISKAQPILDSNKK
jgi:multiple sugar transport system substrate-binding protein